MQINSNDNSEFTMRSILILILMRAENWMINYDLKHLNSFNWESLREGFLNHSKPYWAYTALADTVLLNRCLLEIKSIKKRMKNVLNNPWNTCVDFWKTCWCRHTAIVTFCTGWFLICLIYVFIFKRIVEVLYYYFGWKENLRIRIVKKW